MHSSDYALAEFKNGSVVRRHQGHAHIPHYCATLVNAFCADRFNRYTNLLLTA
jgi:hypothetical protein